MSRINIADGVISIATNSSDAIRELRAIRSAMEDMRNSASQSAGGIGQGGMVGSIIFGSIGAGAIQEGLRTIRDGVVAFTSELIQSNAQLQQQRTSLGVLFQDQEYANKFLLQARDLAARTPFQTTDLISGAQMLKQFGFEAKELLPTLTTLGDAAAAAPQGMEFALKRMTYAFGQIRGAGKLMTQDLRQLTEVGVPVWDILAQKMGLTVAQVQEKVKDRAITAGEGIAMLLEGITERFGGMMEKQSQQWNGLMSTLRDSWQIFLQDSGSEAFGAITNELRKMVGILNDEAFKTAGQGLGLGIKEAVGGIGDLLSAMLDLKNGGVSALESLAAYTDMWGTGLRNNEGYLQRMSQWFSDHSAVMQALKPVGGEKSLQAGMTTIGQSKEAYEKAKGTADEAKALEAYKTALEQQILRIKEQASKETDWKRHSSLVRESQQLFELLKSARAALPEAHAKSAEAKARDDAKAEEEAQEKVATEKRAKKSARNEELKEKLQPKLTAEGFRDLAEMFNPFGTSTREAERHKKSQKQLGDYLKPAMTPNQFMGLAELFNPLAGAGINPNSRIAQAAEARAGLAEQRAKVEKLHEERNKPKHRGMIGEFSADQYSSAMQQSIFQGHEQDKQYEIQKEMDKELKEQTKLLQSMEKKAGGARFSK